MAFPPSLSPVFRQGFPQLAACMREPPGLLARLILPPRLDFLPSPFPAFALFFPYTHEHGTPSDKNLLASRPKSTKGDRTLRKISQFAPWVRDLRRVLPRR